jgi:glyoxylase-like metal-dependent hydrolase (beta-lactamase superfamily II)
MNAEITAFFDPATFTITYVIAEPEGSSDDGERYCAILDSVLDFDYSSGRTATTSADKVIDFIKSNSLVLDWILESHPHADHVTAAPHIQAALGGKTAIGENVTRVQKNFQAVYNLDDGFQTDGSQFDHLFADDEKFNIGQMTAKAIYTPGHTPSCVCYQIGDAVFVGDTMFMPDFGSARCDFPDGDARQLFQSIQRILSLPPETRLFMCHDYAPGGREYAWETTVGEQRETSIHLNDSVGEEDFVKMRTERDAQLSMPGLILPAIQLNIRAGRFPEPEGNGVSYLKLPMNAV